MVIKRNKDHFIDCFDSDVANLSNDIKVSYNNVMKEVLKYNWEEQPNFKGNNEQLSFLRYAELMYRQGTPIITDQLFDMLIHKYDYTEALDIASASGRNIIPFIAPLLSIQKITSYNDAIKWMKQNFKEDEEILIQPKLDGATLNVEYQLKENEYIPIHYTSRGNGRYGMGIWPHALDGVILNGVPESIPINLIKSYFKDDSLIPSHFELRGELVFNKEKNKIDKNSAAPLRNIVAGIMNRKENPLPDPNSKKYDPNYKQVYLDLVSFSMSFPNHKYGHFIDLLECFKYNSLNIIPITRLNYLYKETKNNEEGWEQLKEILYKFYGYNVNTNKRDFKIQPLKYNDIYPMDGICIKKKYTTEQSQQVEPRISRGKTLIPKYPADVIAIKLPGDPVPCEIKEIQERETKLGNYTYSAILKEPVKSESGAMVKMVNVHNKEWLNMDENKWIQPNTKAWVTLSMDIIPILHPWDEYDYGEYIKYNK